MATKIPDGAQFLIYPMEKCTVAAGFKNTKYLQAYKYQHYGIDCDALSPATYNVLASGEGTVLATEYNPNNLGNIVVIRYNNVYLPTIKTVKDVIVRYYHLRQTNVRQGAKLKAYHVIGNVDSRHKMWNHIHMEIDTDTAHPYHTPQVAESSSKLLVSAGATDSTLLNPIDVLVIGGKQTAIVHPNAIYADAKDKPKYKESDFIIQAGDTVLDAQKLILPVNNATITAGYKNSRYATRFGFRHYGLDMIGDTTVYASGTGTVLACGLDSVLGNVIAIKYPQVYNHKTGKTTDVIMRYNHLASIRVRKGQHVDKDTVLGVMGNTGKYSQGVHLHVEADTDVSNQYACYTPTLSGNGTIMKAGRDTTINPAEVLHIKTSAPDKQSIRRLYDGYSCNADVDMVKI